VELAALAGGLWDAGACFAATGCPPALGKRTVPPTLSFSGWIPGLAFNSAATEVLWALAMVSKVSPLFTTTPLALRGGADSRSVWPTCSRSASLRPLRRFSSATDTPVRWLIPSKVSP